MKDDGDLIRGLGFVALHCAYLEETIDGLLVMHNFIKKYDVNKFRPISQKIDKTIDVVTILKNAISDDPDCSDDLLIRLDDLCANLAKCVELFKKRNEFIHGAIYDKNGLAMLKISRDNSVEREITSQELYDFANEVYSFKCAIFFPEGFPTFNFDRAKTIYMKLKNS